MTSAEVEESPLLEAVTEEWLVKTQQAGKSLAGAVMIKQIMEISGGAVLSCVYKWPINPFASPNPISTHSNK
jgi:hypothetical protein